MRPDVLVVGAGVMGCALAWRLAQQRVRVVVLERAVPGAEASSAAAGILAPHAEAKGVGPLLTLGRESLARYPAWADELGVETGIDVGFRQCGLLHVALDAAGVSAHEARLALLASVGAEVERLAAPRELHPWLGEAREALWMPSEGTVDNVKLVEALHEAASAAGVTFLTGHTVRGATETTVDTDTGPLDAGAVAICAGAWTSSLGDVPVRPVRGQVMAVDAGRGALPCVVYGAGRGYLVPRLDGRVLVGATEEEAGFEKAVTPAGLLHLAGIVRDLYPALSARPVLSTWSGFRPGTPDDLPVIGGLDSGPWIASGHHRNGILLTPITAESLAALILGEAPPVDVSAFSPHREALRPR